MPPSAFSLVALSLAAPKSEGGTSTPDLSPKVNATVDPAALGMLSSPGSDDAKLIPTYKFRFVGILGNKRGVLGTRDT